MSLPWVQHGFQWLQYGDMQTRCYLVSRTLTIASYSTSPKSIKDADPSGISTLVHCRKHDRESRHTKGKIKWKRKSDAKGSELLSVCTQDNLQSLLGFAVGREVYIYTTFVGLFVHQDPTTQTEDLGKLGTNVPKCPALAGFYCRLTHFRSHW
jgi:hypothetical protein